MLNSLLTLSERTRTVAITKEDVTKVAGLARLAISDKDAELYTDQLGRILSHVDKLSELDTEGVEATSYTVPLVPVMREDEARKPIDRDKALENAPEKAKGCFKVPQIIE